MRRAHGARSASASRFCSAARGLDRKACGALAELGFIVIQLDALGSSPQRSKAFEDFFYGHVGDNSLPDQIAAIRQLAAKYSWMDTTRVGVFGHSGGGYSAAAAMVHHPDFFKVGVSGSGNHDFRVYGWYWGEKYQGLYRKRAPPTTMRRRRTTSTRRTSRASCC
jgi:dipeptidyl aminopeptidase/acylaminoacyl peptidase